MKVAGKFAHLAVRARLIDQHALDVGAQQVAQDPQVQRQIGVHQMPGTRAQAFLTDELPELAQIHHVGAQRLGRRVFRRRAHDESGALVGSSPASTALRRRSRSASFSMRAETPTPRPCGM